MDLVTSAFGWLDHDDASRRRMMEVINLFREKGTLDELGIGTIRDTFADRFFPGTSTIQTRARYFLFIPWLYLDIERERIPSARAARHARWLQGRLVQGLLAGGEGSSAGIIGVEAGEQLQRLPSTIYWQGLRRWEIRLFEGSTERYHASLDGQYREERGARSSDANELLSAARRNWHGSVPPAPAGLFEKTTFAMTPEEAGFLAERIRRAAADSLLAVCLGPGIGRRRRARAPWDLRGLESAPAQLRQDLDDARRYSLVMEGAALLYNLMMAELAASRVGSPEGGRVDRYGKELARWADEMVGARDELAVWDLAAFRQRLLQLNPRLVRTALDFSETWLRMAIADPRGIRDDHRAHLLISTREHRLKGALARLHNPRALERWSGESGVGRLTYRWGNAQRILVDILNGLDRSADDS